MILHGKTYASNTRKNAILNDVLRESFLFLFDGGTDPYKILGMHPSPEGLVVRAWLPEASDVWLMDRDGKKIIQLTSDDLAGLFIACVPKRKVPFPYKLSVKHKHGTEILDDPYQYGGSLIKNIINKFIKRNENCLYHFLGATPQILNGTSGIHFTLRETHARQVSLYGPLKILYPDGLPMRLDQITGIWSVFVPGKVDIHHYHFILTQTDGTVRTVSDPFHNNGITCRENTSGDANRMHTSVIRTNNNTALPPVLVYSLSAEETSFNSKEFYSWFVNHIVMVREMGFTHIAVTLSKNAERTDAPDPQQNDLCINEHILDAVRYSGLKLIIAKENIPLPSHQSTNFCSGSLETQSRCVCDNKTYWLNTLHLDGIADETSFHLLTNTPCKKDQPQSEPGKRIINSLKKHVRSKRMKQCPLVEGLAVSFEPGSGVYFLPESDPNIRNITFTPKSVKNAYDLFFAVDIKSFFYVRRLIKEILRKRGARFILPLDVSPLLPVSSESSVRQEKLRAFIALLWSCNSSKLLLTRNTIKDTAFTNSDFDNPPFTAFMKDLNVILRHLNEEIFSAPSSSSTLTCDKENKIFILNHTNDLRRELVVVTNLTNETLSRYDVGTAYCGCYVEILNTDSHFYSGKNDGNQGSVTSVKNGQIDNPYSLSMTIPAFTTIMLYLKERE